MLIEVDSIRFFLVTLGCGSVTSENNSYFEVSDPPSGQCNTKICKANDNVCQVMFMLGNSKTHRPQTNPQTSITDQNISIFRALVKPTDLHHRPLFF